jgi:hypothetical protein
LEILGPFDAQVEQKAQSLTTHRTDAHPANVTSGKQYLMLDMERDGK